MPVVAFENPVMQKHNWSINKMDDSNPFSLREQTIGHMRLSLSFSHFHSHTHTHTNKPTLMESMQLKA